MIFPARSAVSQIGTAIVPAAAFFLLTNLPFWETNYKAPSTSYSHIDAASASPAATRSKEPAESESALISNLGQAATITVDTNSDAFSDDGRCSLPEAIVNANDDAPTHEDCAAGSGKDTIVFTGTGASTIVLSNHLVEINDSDPLTIDGGGHVRIDGAGNYRLILATNNTDLTLQGLVLTNGLSVGGYGGAIDNDGSSVQVIDCAMSDNSALYGGGISSHDGGSVTVVDTTISDNSAVSGGGIASSRGGRVEISNSIVRDNSALRGGGVNVSGGSMLLTHATVTGNRASSVGGGIFNAYGGTVEIVNSTVRDNTADIGGGVFDGNISNGAGSTTKIDGSTVSGNIADFGGGIYDGMRGTLRLSNSTVNANTAHIDGGGIYNGSGGTLTLGSSTVSANTAHIDGGGIYNGSGGATELSNSTISTNTAGLGGGIYDGGGKSALINTTVTNNNTDLGGGGIHSFVGGEVALSNSIIAQQRSGPDCTGAISSIANNLDSDGSCDLDPMSGDIPGGNAGLGPLTDNGGPTETHALFPDSDAIDGGDNAVCAAAVVNGSDQRGVSRPQGQACDIGSVEREVSP